MTLAHKPGSIFATPFFKAPTDYPDSPLSKALQQPVLLGLFLPIQAGGWTNSTLERSTDWRFDYNRDLTLKAEELVRARVKDSSGVELEWEIKRIGIDPSSCPSTAPS